MKFHETERASILCCESDGSGLVPVCVDVSLYLCVIDLCDPIIYLCFCCFEEWPSAQLAVNCCMTKTGHEFQDHVLISFIRENIVKFFNDIFF